uniref:NADH-ubiquinone oxidoreductase chain 4 n=2 Tax=Gracilaria tenuistipitata TaxID=2510778 RepID=A0A2S1PUQ1_GRATE|nr:NADH dehydrogenase subunit 4 [Gracilaria tenuistipitata]ARU07644.1 NADH dehydrogenase subunit 4 [Gracilaria tenuistipitata]AWH62555.1 NADH dehydrogenase subunit 4 [Gracilaria tenuistipitata]AWH62580.1 NADH dehydrogenase subunit 4 [Gracilaria tenuistipitata var. liui]AXI97784.1 NADH dehydrogenase subunit 4 [Gracilaria tenuistipitata]
MLSLALLNPLILVSLTPLLGILVLFIIPRTNEYLCKLTALNTVCLTFLFSLFLWVQFDNTTSLFQFCCTYDWISSINLYYTIGIDGISLFFLLLTTLLTIFCILVSWGSVHDLVKEYLICFLLLEFFLIQVFCVLDLLWFYIFFESVLIPMFLIVGIWGSRERKIRAAYQFFLYTLIGSLLMLLALLAIYFEVGTTDLQVLWYYNFTEIKQIIFWLAFFSSFAVKIPMIPFHIWLPEAHAEAPTAGSVILAGILLKMGGYGFLRFSIPMFPEASIYFTPLIFTLSIVAILYASLTTLRQVDLKKIIAYSSVSHMGFVTIGIFSLNLQGIEGSILLMLSHGLVSSALFLCVGILYDRYKTRILKYYSGLMQVMPIFGIFFLFFSFANLGFPGTSSFIGELLVLVGAFQINRVLTFFASIGMVLGAAYSIWLFNRISFGGLKMQYFQSFQDISRREFWILGPLTFIILWIGIYPVSFLDELHFSVISLIEQLL